MEIQERKLTRSRKESERKGNVRMHNFESLLVPFQGPDRRRGEREWIRIQDTDRRVRTEKEGSNRVHSTTRLFEE